MGNKNFAVGLFVAVALFAFISTSLWLTGRNGSATMVSYSMFFEKDISGLMLGGPVFYLGVEVGAVTAMTIIPGDPMQVQVDIEVLESAPVNAGTFASLALQGITGVSIINLNGDPGVHEPLHKRQGQSNLIIEVRDVGFSALLAKAPDVMNRLNGALEKIEEVLDEENRESFKEILKNVKTISKTLAEKEKEIGELPGLLKKTLQEMRDGMAKLESAAGEFKPEFSATLSNIKLSSEKLTPLLTRIEGWTDANNNEMNAFMEDGLGQVPALISEARNALRELEKLVKDLREDPSMLIYKPAEDAVEVEQP